MQELDRRHVHQCAAKVATPSIANCETVACMSPTVAAPRLATLVGDLADARPAYRALADRIRPLIADGASSSAPASRASATLTTALGVSRTTVTRAYAVLPRQWVCRGAAGLRHDGRHSHRRDPPRHRRLPLSRRAGP